MTRRMKYTNLSQRHVSNYSQYLLLEVPYSSLCLSSAVWWIYCLYSESAVTTQHCTASESVVQRSRGLSINRSRKWDSSLRWYVYSLTPVRYFNNAIGARFPPLLAHTSHPDETHYFPLTDHSNRILLHTHLPAPFVTTSKSDAKGLVLDVFSSGISECTNVVDGIKVSIDWSATFGRWATRYWTSAIVWSVGVTSLIIFYSWDSNGTALRFSLLLLSR